MAAFDAPKGVGARRVSRSIMSSGPGGTNYQNFDPFEASDAGQGNFRLTSQDDEELEVTIPVADDTTKKDVAVRFTARSLRVMVKGESLIDERRDQPFIHTGVLDSDALAQFREKFPAWMDADRFTLEM